MIIDNPMEYIQRQVVALGIYEPGLAHTFMCILEPGDLFFDIGGNIGNHTLVARSCGATVHAFEPVPRLAERIRQNAQLNRATNRLTVVEAAAGAEAGKAQIHINDRLDDGSHSLLEKT